MELWHDCWWDHSQDQVLPILNWDCAVPSHGASIRIGYEIQFCSLLLLVRAFARAAATSSVMWLPIRSSFSNTELGFCNSSQKRACQLAVVMCCKLQPKSSSLNSLLSLVTAFARTAAASSSMELQLRPSFSDLPGGSWVVEGRHPACNCNIFNTHNKIQSLERGGVV